MPALRGDKDAVVVRGAGGSAHAVQRLRHEVQERPAGAGVPPDQQPHLPPGVALQQAQPRRSNAPSARARRPPPPPSAAIEGKVQFGEMLSTGKCLEIYTFGYLPMVTGLRPS